MRGVYRGIHLEESAPVVGCGGWKPHICRGSGRPGAQDGVGAAALPVKAVCLAGPLLPGKSPVSAPKPFGGPDEAPPRVEGDLLHSELLINC